MSTPAEVNAFWFESPATSLDELRPKMKRWYSGGPAFDAEIVSRFGALTDHAIDGQLGTWRTELAGCLALILLLDQFPRSVFRGQARGFAGDPLAQELTIELVDGGRIEELGFMERHFSLMPFLHAESVELLERAQIELTKNAELAPPWARDILASAAKEQTAKYLDVVRTFGRFPHRNEALGRTSTPDEVEFLLEWKERQVPQAARENEEILAAKKT